MRETLLRPASILNELKKNKVTHLVWLPDSETSFMFRLLAADGTMDLVPVCREGESIAVAAGLWVGGKVPVVLIQCTGLFESGDSIRGLALDINLPLVMMIGYRGWTRHGVTPDSAARFTEPILHTWGINYYLVESDEDAERISIAFEDARKAQRPVAVLIGSEYTDAQS
jgi:sulfopyruvate decarboxylase TPP-binding subunit